MAVEAAAVQETGLVFAGIHLACVAFSPLLAEPSELTALGIVAAVFEGCAFGLLQALALRAIFGGGPQVPAAIATGFLLANLYDTPFIAAPGAAVAVQWAIGPLACAGLLMVAKRLPKPAAETSGGAEHDRESLGAAPRLLAPFLAAVAIFMLVQGVFAYVTGLGGTGSHAFFDRSNAILVIGVRVVLLVICLTIPAALTPARTLGTAMVLWAVGIATTAAFWENPGNVVGPLVLEAGLYTLQVMALSTTCRIGQVRGIAPPGSPRPSRGGHHGQPDHAPLCRPLL